MARLVTHENEYGQTATFYWRFCGFVQFPNRDQNGIYSVPAIAMFRSFASEQAWKEGKKSLDEKLITFTPVDIGINMVAEAYAAFKNYDVPQELTTKITAIQTSIDTLQKDVDGAEAELADAHMVKITADKILANSPDNNDAQKSVSRADAKISELTVKATSLSRQLDNAKEALPLAQIEESLHLEWRRAVVSGTDV